MCHLNDILLSLQILVYHTTVTRPVPHNLYRHTARKPLLPPKIHHVESYNDSKALDKIRHVHDVESYNDSKAIDKIRHVESYNDSKATDKIRHVESYYNDSKVIDKDACKDKHMNMTSATLSTYDILNQPRLGEFLRIRIQAVSTTNCLQRDGGDFWFAVLKAFKYNRKYFIASD